MCIRDSLHQAAWRVAVDQWTPRHHVIDVGVAVHIFQARAPGGLHEQGIAADRFEGADGAVNAARQHFLRAGEEPGGRGPTEYLHVLSERPRGFAREVGDDDVGAGPANADQHLHHGTVAVDPASVSYTHLRAHETRHDLVCRLLLE